MLLFPYHLSRQKMSTKQQQQQYLPSLHSHQTTQTPATCPVTQTAEMGIETINKRKPKTSRTINQTHHRDWQWVHVRVPTMFLSIPFIYISKQSDGQMSRSKLDHQEHQNTRTERRYVLGTINHQQPRLETTKSELRNPLWRSSQSQWSYYTGKLLS